MKRYTRAFTIALTVKMASDVRKLLLLRKLVELMDFSEPVVMVTHVSLCMIEGINKFGWKMEKEWEEPNERKKNLALFVSRLSPIQCKHYFCEHRALKHHSKNKKCFVCNQPTLWVFSTAHAIRKRMASDRK